MSDFWNILLGVFIGLATNLLSWWILFHGLSPAIRFSPSICKTPRNPTPSDKTKYYFRVKFENHGKRAVIDVEIKARLRLKNLEGYSKGLSQIVDIPLSGSGEIAHRIPYIVPAKKSRSRPILVLCAEVQDEFRNPNNYPEEIVRMAKGKSLGLEDVMKLGSGTYLEIFASGYDEFSGSRKLFLSKRYTANDILLGKFDAAGLEVKPLIEKQ